MLRCALSTALATLLLSSSLALAGDATPCPEVTTASPSTTFDADRMWLHEPGWFTPLDDPETTRLAGEQYDEDEPLMSVTVGDETRAWPVRAMAYHHVANDVVGGTPIAVTY